MFRLHPSSTAFYPQRHLLTSLAIGITLLTTFILPAGWTESLPNTSPEIHGVTLKAAAASPEEQMALTLTQRFREDFQKATAEAREFLSGKQPSDGVLVIDLDETLLDNRAYYARHKLYNSKLWGQWILEADAPAIPETLNLLNWAADQGFQIYFVSGRLESQRKATEYNLSRVGFTRYCGLYLKPNDYPATQSPEAFKAKSRKEIQLKSGRPILMTLGDQESDLRGEGIGRPFKLPNPLYVIP